MPLQNASRSQCSKNIVNSVCTAVPKWSASDSLHVLCLSSSTSTSCSIPFAVNSHTVTNFLKLLKHYGGGGFVVFILLLQFHFLSLNLFSHFVASLLQTGMMLEIYCSQVGADKYSVKHVTAYLCSLHKKGPKNVPVSRHKT